MLQGKGRGALSDTLFRNVTVVAGVLVLGILALIAISTTREAWPAFRESGLDFFTSKTWIPNDPDGEGPLSPQFGALAFIYGTAVVSLIAHRDRGAGQCRHRPVRDRAGAPRECGRCWSRCSTCSPPSRRWSTGCGASPCWPRTSPGFYDWVATTVRPVPVLHTLFGEGGTGRSFMTAGIILAVMITPIITSLTREVFNTVPRGEKDAALALGATRWEMIRGAVFPHSFGGVVGAAMLGLGRAMGETIAVALTIGSSPQIVANLFTVRRRHACGHRQPVRRVFWRLPGRADRPGRGAVRHHHPREHVGPVRGDPVRHPPQGGAVTATAIAPAPPGDPGPDLTRSTLTGRRKAVNGLTTAAICGAVVAMLVPLVFIVGFVVSKGAGIMSGSFLTDDIPRQFRSDGGGMGPAIVGTILITGTAAALAIPLGILGAIYLNEYGKKGWLARLIRFMSDVMTGVPSIVMGLFIYTIWVLRFEKQSGLAGALALACLMLPIVIRSTEEMLRLVPDELRQAALGLGARRWRTTVSIVLPAALPGITSGAMLAVARAAGETAPVLFTISVVNKISWDLYGPNTTLAAQIFRNASQPFQGAQDRAWGAALTLVVLVFVLTLAARAISGRFSIKQR